MCALLYSLFCILGFLATGLLSQYHPDNKKLLALYWLFCIMAITGVITNLICSIVYLE
ncbi:hypothetical protein EniLVp02_0215 [Vibrio phage EniLVp02]